MASLKSLAAVGCDKKPGQHNGGGLTVWMESSLNVYNILAKVFGVGGI